MPKKKRRKNRDEIRDYMLSCECCPLYKETKSTIDTIIGGVMQRFGHPGLPNKHICTAKKCEVNPKKVREECGFREEYWKKSGIRPAGVLGDLSDP